MRILSHKEFLKRKSKRLPNDRYLTFGNQYNAYLCKSDIKVYVGNRGSAKSFTMLYENIPNAFIPKYNAVFFREEVKDAAGVGGIVKASKGIYGQFGKLRESLQHLDWSFPSGANFAFLNYSDPLPDFQKNVQGKEFDKVLIDEGAQMKEKYFNVILANLRSSKMDVRPQAVIACNPDPDSWMKDFLNLYIDTSSKYHTHYEHMNGVETYFFQIGESFRNAVYGKTKEEVYLKAKDAIDELVANSGIPDANPLDAILSVTCFVMPRSENPYMTKTAGGGLAYEARLNSADLQSRIRFLFNGWKKVDATDKAMVKMIDLERWFENEKTKAYTRCASLDISKGKNDKMYLIIWEGYHIEKIITLSDANSLDAKRLHDWLRRELKDNNVPITRDNFVYDGDGLGFALSGHFSEDEAMPFIAQATSSEETKVEAYDDKKVKMYKNAKAEVVGTFVKALKDHMGTGACGLSIDQDVLYSEMYGKTVKYIIENEIRALEWRNVEGAKWLIKTEDADKNVGWHPDLIWAIIYRFALDIGKEEQFTPVQDEDLSEIMCFLGL